MMNLSWSGVHLTRAYAVGNGFDRSENCVIHDNPDHGNDCCGEYPSRYPFRYVARTISKLLKFYRNFYEIFTTFYEILFMNFNKTLALKIKQILLTQSKFIKILLKSYSNVIQILPKFC